MKFNWDGFTKADFVNYVSRVENGDIFSLLHEAYIGNVRVGELCFEFMFEDVGVNEKDIRLTYNLYVGGEDTGYGYSDKYGHNDYPYDYAEGGCFEDTCISMSYEDFQKYAEEVFEKYIKEDGQFYVNYSLIDKANAEFHLW